MSQLKKLHNPKSNTPAVYIPCWLIQVKSNLISHLSKLLYGRLTQWSNAKGTVYRSALQLAEELGASPRAIERCIKELKDIGLIGTFHPQAGGINHFEFYEHEWMYSTIKDEFVYNFTRDTDLPTKMTVPTDKSVGTLPTKVAVINKKEIKEIKEKERESKNTQSYQEVLYNYNFSLPSDSDQKLSNESFDLFYKLYPVKKNETRSRVAWASQRCYEHFNEIITSLNELILHDAHFKEGYAPNPDKWIHEERWKDKPVKRAPRGIKRNNQVSEDWDLNMDKDIF